MHGGIHYQQHFQHHCISNDIEPILWKAGTFLYAQDIQYDTCLNLMEVDVGATTTKTDDTDRFNQWLLELQQCKYHHAAGEQQNAFDNLVKWAFSVVFTRSMRSPNKQHAQIVPIGDMANHDIYN